MEIFFNKIWFYILNYIRRRRMKSILVILILLSVSLDFVTSVKFSKISLSKVKNMKKKFSLFSKTNLQDGNNQSGSSDLLDAGDYESYADGRNSESKQLDASKSSSYIKRNLVYLGTGKGTSRSSRIFLGENIG